MISQLSPNSGQTVECYIRNKELHFMDVGDNLKGGFVKGGSAKYAAKLITAQKVAPERANTASWEESTRLTHSEAVKQVQGGGRVQEIQYGSSLQQQGSQGASQYASTPDLRRAKRITEKIASNKAQGGQYRKQTADTKPKNLVHIQSEKQLKPQSKNLEGPQPNWHNKKTEIVKKPKLEKKSSTQVTYNGSRMQTTSSSSPSHKNKVYRLNRKLENQKSRGEMDKLDELEEYTKGESKYTRGQPRKANVKESGRFIESSRPAKRPRTMGSSAGVHERLHSRQTKVQMEQAEQARKAREQRKNASTMWSHLGVTSRGLEQKDNQSRNSKVSVSRSSTSNRTSLYKDSRNDSMANEEFFKKSQLWLHKRNAKLDNTTLEQRQREMENCTFRPNISTFVPQTRTPDLDFGLSAPPEYRLVIDGQTFDLAKTDELNQFLTKSIAKSGQRSIFKKSNDKSNRVMDVIMK